jgi:anti-anti-sigma factor
VEGEVDLSNIDEFTEQLERLVDDAHSPVVVDLRALSFFDSTALNAVVGAHRRADAQGVQLWVWPSPTALRVIHITGLDTWLNLGGDPPPAAE